MPFRHKCPFLLVLVTDLSSFISKANQVVANRSTRKLGLFIFFVTEDYLCEIVNDSLLSLLGMGSAVKLTTAWLPI